MGPGTERAHVQIPADAGLVRHADHVERGLDVELLEGDAARPTLADDADQVSDRRAALDRGDQALRMQDVARHAIDRFEAAQIALRTRAHEAAHEETASEQRAYDVLADEAGASRDEHSLHGIES